MKKLNKNLAKETTKTTKGMQPSMKQLLARIDPVVRTAVKRVIKIIQREAATYTAQAKAHYGGKKDDVVTTADFAAQLFYVRYFTKHLPGFGFIGEEDGLRKPCTIAGEDIYITLDPLDGTKAFARNQSHGVGTMVAVVRGGVIIASYVGDVNTGEIYGFGPSAPVPTRTRFGVETPLRPMTMGKAENVKTEQGKAVQGKTEKVPQIPLGTRYVLLTEAPWRFPDLIQKMFLPPEDGGLFKDIEVGGGSYGATNARLWKGEVAAVLIDPGHSTPWDETPVMGLHDALGFVTFAFDQDNNTIRQARLPLVMNPEFQPLFLLFIHQEYAAQVREWFATYAGAAGWKFEGK